jgi:hypothetical protein
MSKPLVVVIPHQLGRAAARDRLEKGLSQLKARFGDKVTSVDERWTGDHLDLAIKALSQSVSATLDVAETEVRVEVQLPWLLATIAEKAKRYIEREGQLLLTKK